MLDTRREGDSGQVLQEDLFPEYKKGGEIKSIDGNNNVLVVAPHGFGRNDEQDDEQTDIIAQELADNFGFYAVINTKYQKPKSAGKKRPNAAKGLLDLNAIKDAEKVENNEYLGAIDRYTREIIEKYGKAIVFLIHGAEDNNIAAAGGKIPKDKRKVEPAEMDVLIGYGQWNSPKTERLTTDPGMVDSLIKSFASVKINAEVAPTKSIKVKGEKVWYCGWSPDRMNQYFHKNGNGFRKNEFVDSVQLEFRKQGLRESPEMAKEAATRIGKTLSVFAGGIDTFRTALTNNSVMKEIKAGEIDLNDITCKFRISDYEADTEVFNHLKQSIKTSGIQQNIIVRRVPKKRKYQLVSGFRRVAALQSIFDERGKKKEFPEQLIWAKVYKKLTDDEAYQISFHENLAREDLSLWEIANSCRIIRDKLRKEKKTEGEIQTHLAKIIGRGERTVRRYLQVSVIKNEEIRRDLHAGTMDITIALILTQEGFKEADRAALYGFYKKDPAYSRQLEGFARNLLRLKEWSGLTVEGILNIPTARDFLTIDPTELKERIQFLQQTKDKSVEHLLAHEIKALQKTIDAIKSHEHLSPFYEKFSKKSKSMEGKVAKIFETKKMPATLSLGQSGDYSKKMVKLSITAPATDIPKSIRLVAKELGDDFTALAKLFKQKPRIQKERIVEKKGKTDPRSVIEFTIKLKELQEILRSLNKDTGTDDNNKPGKFDDDFSGYVLIRAIDNNKIQFGRWKNSGLLIDTEAGVQQEGSVIIKLDEVYAPIMRSKGKKDAECVIVGIDQPSKDSEERGTLSIKNKSTKFNLDITTYKQDKFTKMFDKLSPPAPAIRVDASDLKDALGRVLPCINPRDGSPAVEGILFNVDEKRLAMAGTDRAKLSDVVMPHKIPGRNGGKAREKTIDLIVSFYAGRLLNGILRKDSGAIGISTLEGNIYFQAENWLVAGKLITNERYINYEKLFGPAENSFKLPVAKLREIAASARETSDPEEIYRMTIKTNNNCVLFISGKGSAKYPVNDIRGAIDIDTSAKNLAELSAILDGKEVEVRYHSGKKHITFYPDKGNQRALLSTLRRREVSEQTKTT